VAAVLRKRVRMMFGTNYSSRFRLFHPQVSPTLSVLLQRCPTVLKTKEREEKRRDERKGNAQNSLQPDPILDLKPRLLVNPQRVDCLEPALLSRVFPRVPFRLEERRSDEVIFYLGSGGSCLASETGGEFLLVAREVSIFKEGRKGRGDARQEAP
jgi:hypothetical protein